MTPSEYDHCQDIEPAYTGRLAESKTNFSHLRLDLTFDEDSQIVHNTLLRRISSGSSLYFNKSIQKAKRSPIKVSDVQTAVEKCFTDASTDRKSYFLKGDQEYTYEQLIELLEAAAGRKAELNVDWKENTFKPTTFGLVQEQLYTQCYINSQGIIHSQRTGAEANTLDGSELLGSKTPLADFYTANSFVGMKAHGHTWLKKFLLY